MNMDRRSVALSAALMGAAGLAFALVRKQRESDAVRELKGKVVLITGGSRGLGFAIALELASLGARLVLTSRNHDELEAAKTRLVATGRIAPRTVWVQASDVSVPSQIQEVVTAIGHPDFWQADRSQAGKTFRGSLPAIMERLGTTPIQQYNQEKT